MGVLGAQSNFENGVGAAQPAAGAAAAAAPAEVKKEKTTFDLKLTVVDAKAKIKIIKEIRTITGLGLKEVHYIISYSILVSFARRFLIVHVFFFRLRNW